MSPLFIFPCLLLISLFFGETFAVSFPCIADSLSPAPPTKDWALPIEDTPHFHHMGDLIGSLGYGHLVLDIDLKEHERNLLYATENPIYKYMLSAALETPPSYATPTFSREQTIATETIHRLQQRGRDYLDHFRATRDSWIAPFSRSLRATEDAEHSLGEKGDSRTK